MYWNVGHWICVLLDTVSSAMFLLCWHSRFLISGKYREGDVKYLPPSGHLAENFSAAVDMILDASKTQGQGS